MKTVDTDIAIIGAGTAGMTAWRAAHGHTDKVVLVESGPYGTTCARVGCMPSKLLIAAAEAAHTIEHAGRFGVSGGGLRVDGHAVMKRVREERDRFVGFVVETVQGWPEAQRLHGHARFVDANTLMVDDHTLVRVGRVVIATGSSPVVPKAWRDVLGDRLVINDDVFEWQDLPESVAVMGTGVVGLELAQALHRLGVRTRLYGRGGQMGPLTDPLLQTLARDVFAGELPLTPQVSQLEVHRQGDEVLVRAIDPAGEAHEARYDLLLAATGRRPNLNGLNLAAAGLPLDAKGMPLFDRHTGQIGDSHVFIAGDATDDRPLLHEAADGGRIAGDNAGRWPAVQAQPRRTPLSIVFSDPQMMIAGQSHAELLEAEANFATGKVSFAQQGRSRVMGRDKGALRVYGERGSGRFLGAEMLGPAAEHLGHLLAWSAQRGDTVQQMLDSPFYHPVIEEGLRAALGALLGELRRPA